MGVAAHYLQFVDQHGEEIKGESEGHKHDYWIDVTSWNWDVSDESLKNSGTAKDTTARGATSGAARASAGGGEVGIQPSLLTFTKSVDRSTTRLLLAMDEGHVLQKATITLLEELLDVNRKYREAFRLDVVLEDVKIVSYRLSVRASEHRVDLEETWGLNYTTIKFDYVSAGGMNAKFDRPPGSEKGGAARSEVDPVQQQKRIAELEQAVAAAKGKRG
jgi:type VI protein secretion system component Hcp